MQSEGGVVTSSHLQAVINGASTGDTIVISGTCVGNFAIPGAGSATSLTLKGVHNSSLDGNGSGSVLAVGGSGTQVTIKGYLVLKNGLAARGGGINEAPGVSSPNHVNLRGHVRVRSNTAGDGGGVFNESSYLSLGGYA